MAKFKYPKQFTTATPREVAAMVTWPEVQKALRYHYPDGTWSDKNYEPVFERILNAPKRKNTKGEHLEVCIKGWLTLDKEWMKENFEENPSYGVHMVDSKGKVWSISFVKWDRLSNMPYTSVSTRNNTYKELIAHLIWEMTWYGTEAEMTQRGKEVFKAAGKAMKQAKAGTLKTVKMSDALKAAKKK